MLARVVRKVSRARDDLLIQYDLKVNKHVEFV